MYTGEMKAGDHVLGFGDVTYVVGVVNLSPESKNLHTVASGLEEARSLADRYRQWGADVIEVGGQSSHFDNQTIAVTEEIDRIAPVTRALAEEGFVVAVDTWKPPVAEAALDAGAALINDTSGLGTTEMRELLAVSRCGVIAVHVDGDHPHDVGAVQGSDDPAARVGDRFRQLMAEIGADLQSRVIVDPGIAINYRGDYVAYTRHQLQVMRDLGALAGLGRPVLVPIPRKASIHWVAAYITMALENAADLIRVHDVSVAAELVRLWGREVKK